VAGFDVVKDAVALRSVIGLAGQFAAVDELLTGRVNLEMVGRFYHLSRPELRRRAQEVLERFSLTEAGDRLVRTYSGGMRRRLDLGASLVGRPLVLVLDEPTTGLDPRTRIELWEFIESLVAEGTTLLLTTQYLEEADRLAHRIAVVDDGRVIAEGTGDELKDRLGGAVLEVVLADPRHLEQASLLLANLGDGAPQIDILRRQLSIPTQGSAQTIINAAQRLETAHISLVDIALRRPSLDDVFLSLTGHIASDEGLGDAKEVPRTGRKRRRSS
jgi:ABC-type multidrug transport system ATPase subunit